MLLNYRYILALANRNGVISMGRKRRVDRGIHPNRIAELRQRRGLSQTALAILVGTSQQQIDRLEREERRLTWNWMKKLSKALHCHPMDLVDWP